ncbi:MAG: hypothetical protein MZU91_10690 [Desulfosudis oleivorans]|nr:hypothetical protein [Desulfosudis oleivorans]
MEDRWIVALGLVAWSFAAVSGNAPVSGAQAAGARVTAIKNVRVFDGKRVLSSATVLIAGDKVTAVGAGRVPAGAEIIDGAGKTLLPGLIDAHVHIWDESGLRQAAVFGVTVLVDMFTSVEFASTTKRAQERGRARWPISSRA